MTKEIKKIGGGLLKLPEDKRDFKLGTVFGRAELPPDVDFVVSSPIRIKDQGDKDSCTAHAICAVSEDQEGVELNPEYTFAKTKQLEGNFETWGADLRTACKSAVLLKGFGFLEQKIFEEYAKGQPQPSDRLSDTNLRNWESWPANFDELAKKHAKQSYFSVDAPMRDLFDDIRANLWKFREKNQSVVMGLIWCDEWTHAKDGIINKKGTPAFGHAFKVFGQRFINGEPYLVTQLSNGEEIGDKGIFYMSREIINEGAEFGTFMFVDLPKTQAEFLNKHELNIEWRWLAKIAGFFINIKKQMCL